MSILRDIELTVICIILYCNSFMVWVGFRIAHPTIVKWTQAMDKIKWAIPYLVITLSTVFSIILNHFPFPYDDEVASFTGEIFSPLAVFILCPWMYRKEIQLAIHWEASGDWITRHSDSLLEISGILLFFGSTFSLLLPREWRIPAFTCWHAFFLILAIYFTWKMRHQPLGGVYVLLFTWGYAQACTFPMGFSLLQISLNASDLLQLFIGIFFEVSFRIVKEWCHWILEKALGKVVKETSLFHALSYHMVISKEMFNIIFLMTTRIDQMTFWLYLCLNLLFDILDLSPILSWKANDMIPWLKKSPLLDPNPSHSMEEVVHLFSYEIDEFISGAFAKLTIAVSLPFMIIVADLLGQLQNTCGPFCVIMQASGASNVQEMILSYTVLCLQQLLATLLSWWLWKLRMKDLINKGYDCNKFKMAPSDSWKEYRWYLLITACFSCLQTWRWIWKLSFL